MQVVKYPSKIWKQVSDLFEWKFWLEMIIIMYVCIDMLNDNDDVMLKAL